MDFEAPEILKKPLNAPPKIMFSAGPVNVPANVLDVLTRSSMGVLQPEFFKILEEVREGIKYLFQTKNRLTVALSTSGNGGTEAVLCNLLEDGDCVLIAASGFWGDRIVEIAERYNVKIVKIAPKAGVGTNFTFDELEEAIQKHKPKLLMIVHGESSTGALQPLDGLGDICHRYNCLLGVDGVISIGCAWMFMDRWKIDALYCGTQKGLSIPAGLAPISLSPRAEKVLFNRRKKVSPFYFDLEYLGCHFNCFEGERNFKFHHTMNTTLMSALRETLSLIVHEGLENTIQRHYDCAQRFYKGLEKLGLKFYVENERDRLPCVTTVLVPDDLEWPAIVSYLMDTYSIEIGLGLGVTRGKALRLGIMGRENAHFEKVDFFLKALGEALEYGRELRRKGISPKTSMKIV